MTLKQSQKKALSEEAKLAATLKRAAEKKAAVDDVLERFDKLPNTAHVRLPVVKSLYGCSAASIWRYVKKGIVPAPRKFGSRVSAWNVLELKTNLAG